NSSRHCSDWEFRPRCCISPTKAIGCLSRRTRGFGTRLSTIGSINGASNRLSCRAKSRHLWILAGRHSERFGSLASPRLAFGRPVHVATSRSRSVLDFARNDSDGASGDRPLTFCASCALKRFENLWNVPSSIFYTEFSLSGSFYSSQGAAKTRAFRATRSIWAVLTGASRLPDRATPSRIGTAITPAVVPPLRSTSENSAA